MGEGPGQAVTRVLLFGLVVLLGISRGYLDGQAGQSAFEYGHRFSMSVFLIVMVPYFLLRLALALRTHPGNEATLILQNLNNVHSFKDIMNNYLQAALLEPILAIYGQDSLNERRILINLLMLASIAWWTWVISDAFDYSDVEQEFRYSQISKEIQTRKLEERVNRSFIRTQQDEMDWLVTDHSEAHWQYVGSMFHDLSLWFSICCIMSAIVGVVRHSDVLHAYFMVILWLIMHHLCHSATSWGQNYLVSMLLPSAALLPIQFCFLLRSAENFEELVQRRKFIHDRCGLQLRVVASVVTTAKVG
jgi:hypothetical protein